MPRHFLYSIFLGGFLSLQAGTLNLPCPIKSELYIVGIGTDAIPNTEDLALKLSSTLGIKVRQLPPRGLDMGCYNLDRKQFDSHCLLDRIQASFPEIDGRKAVIIAVTRQDIYIPGVPWIFAFSYRDARGIAAVSAARMSLPATTSAASEGDTESSRIRKMVLKNIGIMYFGMSPKADPQSVLYDKILGLEELDQIEERF